MKTNQIGDFNFQNENHHERNQENFQPGINYGNHFYNAFFAKDETQRESESDKNDAIINDSSDGSINFSRQDGSPDSASAENKMEEIIENESVDRKDIMTNGRSYRSSMEWDDEELDEKVTMKEKISDDNEDPANNVELVNKLNQKVINDDRLREE